MAKVKGQYAIPFAKNGDLLKFAYRGAKDITWINNYKFQDELEFVSYSHGRSSVQMYLKSVTDGRRYNMSLSDFSECIVKNLLNNKRIKGEFTFIKRGTNYMLTPVFPTAP